MFILFDGTLSLYFEQTGAIFYQVTLTYAVLLFCRTSEIPTEYLPTNGYKKTMSIASICMIIAAVGYYISTNNII
jgi:hypothetical protein